MCSFTPHQKKKKSFIDYEKLVIIVKEMSRVFWQEVRRPRVLLKLML